MTARIMSSISLHGIPATSELPGLSPTKPCPSRCFKGQCKALTGKGRDEVQEQFGLVKDCDWALGSFGSLRS